MTDVPDDPTQSSGEGEERGAGPGLASGRRRMLGLSAGGLALAALPARSAQVQEATAVPGANVLAADRRGRQPADGQIAAALERSYADFNRTLLVPNGQYSKSALTSVRQGVMIVGEGSQGSSYDSGTAFVQSGEDAFEWTGRGKPFQGTGGGLKNALIVKETGSHRGTAIRLQGNGDNHRPGEMMFENVLVYAKEGADWRHGLHIDGRNDGAKAGTRGIRSVVLIKARFADATAPGETVVLEQVSHFYAFGLAIDQGRAGMEPGIALRGHNDGVYFEAASIGGSITIAPADRANSTRNFHFQGKIAGIFRNDDPGVNGTLLASFSSTGRIVLINRSPDLRCVTNLNPAFILSRSKPDVALTGNGTVVKCVFDRIDADAGNNFAPGLNANYRAFCAGRHQFVVTLALAGLGSDHREVELSLRQQGSRERVVTHVLPLAGPGPSGLATVSAGAAFDLAFGDTVEAEFIVRGGSRTVAAHGVPQATFTSFEGHYLS